MNYYNEIDKKSAAWIRELVRRKLIPNGHVDTRSITDVSASDLSGYRQCHFFAGIGGWPLALQEAGIPADAPLWTGSAPCQPFSNAGRQLGTADERHLWPAFAALIEKRQPRVVFGEQVSQKAGRAWFSGVQTDLERMGYGAAAIDTCAAGVGAPHARQRLYWVAEHPSFERLANCYCAGREFISEFHCEAEQSSEPEERRRHADGRCIQGDADCIEPNGAVPRGTRKADRPGSNGLHGLLAGPAGEQQRWKLQDQWQTKPEGRSDLGFWDDFEWVYCGDERLRRIEPGLVPMAHGLPARMVRLRGYGNAICIPQAVEFIEAWKEIR